MTQTIELFDADARAKLTLEREYAKPVRVTVQCESGEGVVEIELSALRVALASLVAADDARRRTDR